ncbi:uncharacterized protein LOC125759856 [Rhipicephalus sanguineus]|uniref:uncharacterized protein LOC125759856 n=1 Tax=Rhipicephalus sanguineus TaxID=34632 RepID=UPI0020C23EC2|nr:uncharacterized protein LOC125759856 [Rhipicephalus sanguineus]
MIFPILPFLIDCAAAGAAGVIDVPREYYEITWQDLLDFLGTSQAIWQKQISVSLKSKSDCVRWVKERLTEDDYYFTKWDRVGLQTRKTWHQHATLFNKSGIPAMKILSDPKKSDGEGQVYILYYWDRNEHCALFRKPVPGTDDQQWTQHVWNENVKSTPVCDNAFEKVEFGRYSVYKSNC